MTKFTKLINIGPNKEHKWAKQKRVKNGPKNRNKNGSNLEPKLQ